MFKIVFTYHQGEGEHRMTPDTIKKLKASAYIYALDALDDVVWCATQLKKEVMDEHNEPVEDGTESED